MLSEKEIEEIEKRNKLFYSESSFGGDLVANKHVGVLLHDLKVYKRALEGAINKKNKVKKCTADLLLFIVGQVTMAEAYYSISPLVDDEIKDALQQAEKELEE